MPTPSVTAISGQSNTGITNTSQLVRDVDPKVFYLQAFQYPLASLLMTMGTRLEKDQASDKMQLKGSQIKKKKTVNPKFEHTENEMLKSAFNPTASVAAVDATITISTSDDDYFVAGMDILLVNAAGSREIARVTSVGSGSLTVTRNVGSTGAIALTTGDFFYNMGVVRAEDSVSTTSIQAKGETLYNYVEFLSEPFGLSEIEQATQHYDLDDPYESLAMQALARMKQKLEFMFWFGHRDILNSGTNPVYHNGGILYWLESQFTDVNILDVGGILTKQAWEAWLADGLRYNSMNKFVFCSQAVMTAVAGFASNSLALADINISVYGTVIQKYMSPNGVVYLVREPLFDEVSSMNGAAVMLDMANVSLRYLDGNGKNLDLKRYDEIQENDRAGKKGEWKGVVGIDVWGGKTHSILKNVQS